MKRKYLIAIVLLVVLIGGYTGLCYYKTEHEAKKKADYNVNLILDPEHVRETGYILDLRVTRDLMENEKKILWWVKFPSTNRIYSCSWEGGFSEYGKDEGVILIHIPGGTDTVNWDGYIIGLHGRHKGKRTHVWAVDVDDLYFDLSMDED